MNSLSTIDDEDAFLYGHPHPPGEEPARSSSRDPRLRKRLSSEGHQGPEPRSMSHDSRGSSDIFPPGDLPVGKLKEKYDRERSRRSRSRDRRSRSPRDRRYDRRGGDGAGDDEAWKRKAEAFLQGIGATDTRPNVHQQFATANYGQAYPASTMGYGQFGGASQLPPGFPNMSIPPPVVSGFPGAPGLPTSDRGRSPDGRGRTNDKSASEDEEEASVNAITEAEKEKLQTQKEQYDRALEKMEDHLLKLKEEREDLKERGHKHEDDIMRKNAKLQKEVKSRIQIIKEGIDKLEDRLRLPVVPDSPQPPAPPVPEVIPPMKLQVQEQKEERRVSRRRSSSREKSEEKEKTKKKKKKKSKDRSSSDDDSDREREREKKKKKKKKKAKSSSSSDSDSDSDSNKKSKKQKNVIHMDESVFRMLADTKSSGKSSKKSDEMLMDLLGKMSEAYMKEKQTNNELTHRIHALESENSLLKKQLSDQSTKAAPVVVPPPVPPPVKQEPPVKAVSKWDQPPPVEKVKRSDDELLDEVLTMPTVKQEKNVPLPASRDASFTKESKEDNTRSIRSKMFEKEQTRRSRSNDRNQERSPDRTKSQERRHHDRSPDRRHRDFSPSDRGRHHRGHYEDDRRDRYDNDRHHDRRGDRYGDRYTDRRSRDHRSQRSEEKTRAGSAAKDRNDRIDLEEWSAKPSAPPVDPTLKSLKEKLRAKEVEEDKKEERKRQWTAISDPGSEGPPAKQKEEDPPLPPQPPPPRPQVNIQWGQGVKKTSEPQPQPKKAMPIVGKMPWLQRGKRTTPEPTKPPASQQQQFNIPPPSLLTNVPAPVGMYPQQPQPYMMPAGPLVPPVNPPLPKRPPPKNPNPASMDIQAMLAAAQAHIRARSYDEPAPPATEDIMIPTPGAPGEIEIPLPPLPAAQDKDPDALLDTRPPKEPTPPPPKEKTEMELMIEQHENGPQNLPGEYGAMYPAPPPSAGDGPHQGNGFDTADQAQQWAKHPPQEIKEVKESVPTMPPKTMEEGMNPEELAMLGIDPSDFAGFGK